MSDTTLQTQTIEQALESVDQWFGKGITARQRYELADRSMRIINSVADDDLERRALSGSAADLAVSEWTDVIIDASRALLQRRTTRHTQLLLIELFKKLGKTPEIIEQELHELESSVKILSGMMRIERVMLGRKVDPNVTFKRIAIDELRYYNRNMRWLLAIWNKSESEAEGQ